MSQGIQNFNSTYNYGDTEIEISNLLATILRKSTAILSWTIILALTVGMIGCISQYTSAANQYGDQNLETIEENMTDNEIQNVNILYRRYKAYQLEISSNQSYIDSSPLMNLDSNDVIQMSIGYLICSDQTDLVSFFSQYALGQEEYNQIANVYGDNVNADYISEVVSITTPSNVTDSQSNLNITTDDGSTIFNGGTISKEYSQLMNISILGSTKNDCKEISSIVQNAILSYADKLKNSGVTLTITKVSDTYKKGIDKDLFNQQQEAITNNSNLVNAYNTFVNDNVSSLSDEQQQLFTFLLNRDDQKQVDINWRKYFIIGAVIGFFTSILIVIIRYLSSGKIHTMNEISEMMRRYRMKNQTLYAETIGFFHREIPHKRLNRKIQKAADKIEFSNYPGFEMDKSTYIEITASRIQNLLNQNAINQMLEGDDKIKIFLAQNLNNSNDYCREIIEKLQEKLGEKGIGAETGNISINASDINAMTRCDAAVMVTMLHDIRRTEFENQMRTCLESGTCIIGTIAIAET